MVVDRKSSSLSRPAIAIVQARMGSTRLPGKVLADVAGKPVLTHVVDRLRLARNVDEIIIATSGLAKDEPIVNLGNQMEVRVFRGDEEDVLGRYYHAAHWCEAKTVIRISGEDLLIDPRITDQIVDLHLGNIFDYTSNTIGRSLVDGLYVEAISIDALDRAYRQATAPEEREHVTPYIVNNPEFFRIQIACTPESLKRPDIKLCVDTLEDLEKLRMVFRCLYREGEIVNTEEAVAMMDKILMSRHKYPRDGINVN